MDNQPPPQENSDKKPMQLVLSPLSDTRPTRIEPGAKASAHSNGQSTLTQFGFLSSTKVVTDPSSNGGSCVPIESEEVKHPEPSSTVTPPAQAPTLPATAPPTSSKTAVPSTLSASGAVASKDHIDDAPLVKPVVPNPSPTYAPEKPVVSEVPIVQSVIAVTPTDVTSTKPNPDPLPVRPVVAVSTPAAKFSLPVEKSSQIPRPLQPFRLKRKSRVEYVTEWEGSDLSWENVTGRLEKREDMKVWYDDHSTGWSYKRARRTPRSYRIESTFETNEEKSATGTKSDDSTIRSLLPHDEKGESKRPPVFISQVDYDRRYLQFEETLFGKIPILIRPPFFDPKTIEPFTGDGVLESLPDTYDTRSSSLVGRRHQAGVPSTTQSTPFRDDPDVGNLYEESGTMWDPVRAKIAEDNGEDIYGFVEQTKELVQIEFRMEILHFSGYSVSAAKASYKHLCKYVGGEPSSILPPHEAKQFLRQVLIEKKDFTKIAKIIGRRPLQIMVHYYRWKRQRPEEYTKLKSNLHTDVCYECGDGGDLIICDECDHSYHKKCVGLQHVPKGDWYCKYCEPDVQKRGATHKEVRPRSVPRYSPPKKTQTVLHYNPETKQHVANFPPREIPPTDLFRPGVTHQFHSQLQQQPQNHTIGGYPGQIAPHGGYFYDAPNPHVVQKTPDSTPEPNTPQANESIIHMPPPQVGSKVMDVTASPAAANNVYGLARP